MTGVDIAVPQLKISVHQPTIKEISYIGEEDFFTAIHYLTLDKKDFTEDKNQLSEFSNFQILMKVLEQSEEQDKKNILIQFLTLLFPNYRITFTPVSIILIGDNETVMIDTDNFSIIQQLIRDMFNTDSLFGNQNKKQYNPADAKAEEIAKKIYESRKKIANQKSLKKGGSIFGRYISILSIATGLPNLEDSTVFKLFDLNERYQLWYAQDMDTRVRLAGGDPKDKIENWMKDIYAKD